MDPIEVLKAIIPTLPEKQKEELRQLLGVNSSVCDRLGHKFVKAGQVMTSWVKPPETKMVCERCGLKLQ